MSLGPQPIPESAWFKSSYSGGNATECLEAAVTPSSVLVRDSKLAKSPVVVVRAEAWRCLVNGLPKEGPLLR
ncbi:DUF397 domain-containing protein [Streptomyces sp. NPDC005648]|uniref:DUF397 domain-containing protein n=1 Tax=Streptomyces sp. NPDC005648 TaxID=3157044 RepID=UPI0033ADFE0B